MFEADREIGEESARYTLHIVLRLASIVLLCTFAGNTVPAWFLADPESSLPACCRRDGKHHCAMMEAAERDSSCSLRAAQRRCPQYPSRGRVDRRASNDIGPPGRVLAQCRCASFPTPNPRHCSAFRIAEASRSAVPLLPPNTQDTAAYHRDAFGKQGRGAPAHCCLRSQRGGDSLPQSTIARRFLAPALLFAVAGSPMFSQETIHFASLSGRVADASGAPMSKARKLLPGRPKQTWPVPPEQIGTGVFAFPTSRSGRMRSRRTRRDSPTSFAK